MKILKSDILRLFVSLFIIAAVVSLMLGGVNALTKGRIAELESEAELEAIRACYDYDALFEKSALEDGTEYFTVYKPVYTEVAVPAGEPEEGSSEEASDAGSADDASSADGSESSGGAESTEGSEDTGSSEGSEASESSGDGGSGAASGSRVELVPTEEKDYVLGYAITVSENGYGGEMKMLVCFDAYGKVNGMSVISDSETNGVGSRIKGEGFFDQFTGKAGPFKFVKNSASSKSEIVAISGASISSKAAVASVNKAYAMLSDLFDEE